DARCGRLNGQHLARSCLGHGSHVRRTTPLGRHHTQRSLVRAPERACEAAAVQIDGLQHLTTFAHAHATLVGDVPVPDGVCGVEADAVGETAVEVGPYPPVRHAAVGRDVEGRELLAVGLCEDQRRVVGRHYHAVGECDAICYLPSGA